MTGMQVVNRTTQTSFYDSNNFSSHKSIIHHLKIEDIANASLENHIANCHKYTSDPSDYAPVIKGIYPIPPKTSWDFSSASPKLIHSKPTTPPQPSVTVESFTEIIQKLSSKFHKEKVAVELSGGLDTSLIISLLRAAGMDPILIGLCSDRYEFRTERVIQNLYLSNCSAGKLIDYTTALPFARLDKTPVHEVPNKSCLHYYGHEVIAETAHQFGATLVLNGIGIEPFLVEPITSDNNPYLLPLTMEDSWADEYIFRRHQTRYVNVVTLKPIYHLVSNLRKGQPRDTQKNWARKYFSRLLPRELSDYSYKAAFDGLFQEGINTEQKTINNIFNCAYEVTGNPKLKASSVAPQLEQASQLEHNSYIELIGKLSFATWIFSLIRERVVN